MPLAASLKMTVIKHQNDDVFILLFRCFFFRVLSDREH